MNDPIPCTCGHWEPVLTNAPGVKAKNGVALSQFVTLSQCNNCGGVSPEINPEIGEFYKCQCGHDVIKLDHSMVTYEMQLVCSFCGKRYDIIHSGIGYDIVPARKRVPQ